MGPPTFNDGDVLGATDVNEWLRGPLFVRKSTDETITNDTNLHVDSELTINVGAHKRYWFEVYLRYQSHADNDIKVRLDAPALAIIRAYSPRQITGSTGSNEYRFDNVTEESTLGLGAFGNNFDVSGFVRGLLSIGVNPGPFRVQWAQVTAGGAPCILRANSYIALWRVE